MLDAPVAEPHDDLDVSVIIPARAATPHVLRIAKLLAEQEQDFSFEILLVLNHEERPIEAGLPPRARILFCPERGAFAARNTGIRSARGRIHAFMDSDVTPASSWLKEGYESVRTSGGNMIVAGRIAPFYEERNSVAIFESAFYFNQERYVLSAGFGSTANLWVPAHVMNAVGPFDTGLCGAADIEFGLRAAKAGFSMAYAKDCVVGHPARTGLFDLLAKERRLSGGDVLLARHGNLNGRPPVHLAEEFRWALRRCDLIRKAHRGASHLKLQAISLAVLAVRAGEKILVRAGKPPLRH